MNKITKNLSVTAGVAKSAKHYGLAWGTYQASGGYKGVGAPRNPTPSDKAQEHKKVPSIGEVYKTVPNRAKINVRQPQTGRKNKI